MILVEETEAIAIDEATDTCHIKRVAPYLLDRSHKLTYRLGGIVRGDAWLTTIDEIRGVAPIERTVQIGFERIFTMTIGSPAITVRVFTDYRIQQFAVGCRHILDISHILKPTLDFKGGGSSLYQLSKVGTQVQILQ